MERYKNLVLIAPKSEADGMSHKDSLALERGRTATKTKSGFGKRENSYKNKAWLWEGS